MTSVSLFCLKREVDKVLEALSTYGEFHIEQAEEVTDYSEVTRSIQKAEETLTDINDLKKNLNTEKTKLTDIFRKEETIKTKVTSENWQTLSQQVFKEIAALKTEASKHLTKLNSIHERNAELQHTKQMLSLMKEIEFDYATTEKLQMINVIVANAPTKDLEDLDRALNGLPMVLHRCRITRETQFFCAAFPVKHKDAIEKTLKQHHAEIFKIPQGLPRKVAEAIVEIDKELSQNSNEETNLKTLIQKIGEKNKNRILSFQELLENIMTILQAKRRILQSGRIAALKGFVPQKKFYLMKEKVTSELGDNVIIIDNLVPAFEDPPSKISNNRFIKPFEEITKLYGVPHYDELDPTPILAFSFPLIFGLMFGDIGHGLILLVGGLALGGLIKRNSSIKNICWILAACGIGAIIMGLLFGEFFGLQVFAPLWFSPFDNVLSFLIFSLVVGVIQITSGLVLDMINSLLKRNFVDALLVTVPKIAFYFGGVYLIVTYQLNFGVWLEGPFLLALVPFSIMVFGKPALNLTQKYTQTTKTSHGKVSLGERFFESSDFAARLISNTMSYTRILALLMAHWALILVTYVVADLVGYASPASALVSGIIIVGGNLFVIALEGLIVFIHALRLHFYEWFSKFYQGNGTEFNPFKQKYVHTELEIGNQESKKTQENL